jgi:hypothetical protein
MATANLNCAALKSVTGSLPINLEQHRQRSHSLLDNRINNPKIIAAEADLTQEKKPIKRIRH